MIKHVLCIKLKDYSEENAILLRDKLLTMRGNVPCAVEVNAGTDFLHSDRSFDVILEVTLESKEALDIYQKDKFHCEQIKPYVQSVRERSVAVDYEI